MKGMVFAAGLGKRLGGITHKIPKALVEINGRTMLQIAIEKLVSHGFDEIIVNMHHHAVLVEEEIEKLRKRGYNLSVSDERDLLLETGGGLFKARWFFDKNPFLLFNADVITDIDLNALYNFHLAHSRLATLAVGNWGHSRVFLTDNSGRIVGWRNKETGEEIIVLPDQEDLIEVSFSGIHVVSPDIFPFMEEGIYSMTTLYLKLAGNHNILSWKHDSDYWADIGTPGDLDQVRKHFKR